MVIIFWSQMTNHFFFSLEVLCANSWLLFVVWQEIPLQTWWSGGPLEIEMHLKSDEQLSKAKKKKQNYALQRKWLEELPTVHERVDPYSGFNTSQETFSNRTTQITRPWLKGKVRICKERARFSCPLCCSALARVLNHQRDRRLQLRTLSLTTALSERLQGNVWQLGGLGPTPTIWQTL